MALNQTVSITLTGERFDTYPRTSDIVAEKRWERSSCPRMCKNQLEMVDIVEVWIDSRSSEKNVTKWWYKIALGLWEHRQTTLFIIYPPSVQSICDCACGDLQKDHLSLDHIYMDQIPTAFALARNKPRWRGGEGFNLRVPKVINKKYEINSMELNRGSRPVETRGFNEICKNDKQRQRERCRLSWQHNRLLMFQS